MFKILEKRQLSNDVFYMKITAPEIARNRKAGNCSNIGKNNRDWNDSGNG